MVCSDESLHFNQPVSKQEFPMSIIGRGYGAFQNLVAKLDNAMFNHNGSAGPHYKPTRHALLLPALAGLATAIYIIYLQFQGHKNDMAALQPLLVWLPCLVGGNILLTIGHVFRLPTWTRRIFYPIFIAVVTLIFFAFTTFVSVWLLFFAAIFFFAPIIFGAAFGSHGGSSSSGSSSYREEAHVDDGSIWGKTLTREGGVGDWHDGCGGAYEEVSGGFQKKY